MSDRLRTEILSELNDAWLNISYEKGDLAKPLDLLTTEDPEEFYKTFTWLMIQPEYFCFLCKNILNIDLVPFQGLMLEEIWKRKFPMLIGSRGVGKATRCTEPLLTDQGWIPMGDINIDHKVYGRDGLTHNITGIYPQGKKQVCRLKFADGREIDCCEDHLWVMKKQKKEITISTKDIINDGVRFDSPSGKWAYKYKLPLTEPIQYEEKELPLDPYILGCLLGDGCMTTKTPKIASDDMFIIDQFRSKLKGFKIEKDTSNNNYTIVDIDKQLNKRFSTKGNPFYKRDGNRLVKIIEGMNLNVGCKDKFIPEEYKTSSVEHRMEMVRGLLDTDGSCNKDGAIEFTNTCKQLVDDLIDILRSLGISCQWKISDRSGTYSKIKNQIIPRGKYYRVFINTSKDVFKLPRKLERIKLKETSREKYTSLISAEYVNEFEEMQCISVDSPDHTYITKDYIVTHNTFLLSLYSLMRALIMPERKVVVVGAAFRQSKFLHEYMENIWKRAPILRDICDSNSGPRTGVDMCRMIINGSTVTAIPVGDGSKIRGLRANDIISDEFASQSLEIFENVVAGFGAVSASPSDGVKLAAAKKLAKEKGYDPSILQDNFGEEDHGNQIVLSGTAYYDFNHFSTYWKRWRAIIQSQGDPVKLKEIFGEEEIPDGFDWREYSVIRMPFELIPKGFMDDAQVARSKATVHNGIYLMEFSACGVYDTPIITKNGIKNLGEVEVGDQVLTHKGRFKSVTKRMRRKYEGDILKLNSYGYYKNLIFTPEHPFWDQGEDFIDAENIKDNLYLAQLNELSNMAFIDTTEICTNFIDRDDFIYPRSSQTKIDNDTRKDILGELKSGKTQTHLSRKYGVSQSCISAIKNENRRPKNSIPQRINLNYDFGVCVGYYASEGSIGSGGNACSFALDGHIDKTLEHFVNQLSDSLYKSLSIKPKLYKHENIISVNINSRVFAEVIKHICPGDCYTKIINHDILFSNPQFLKGFIIGMWNGDGHINKDFACLQLTNKNLINQVKLGLSYFGINASFVKPKKNKFGFIKGKKVNLSPCWKLNISGGEFRKFKSIFYNTELIIQEKKDKVYNENKRSVYRLKNKTSTPYTGMVYNLEVEDDHSYSTPNATVHNCFCTDSAGFFKRSLIEACTGSEQKPIKLPEGELYFDPSLKGEIDKQYIIGVDPASEVDNFSIVVLEVNATHRRIAHVWTTTRKEYRERLKRGLTEEGDFYAYCARRIRDLMGAFPTIHIAMDAQGGGIAVSEALHDPARLQPGELPIWPTIDEEKEKSTDDEQGLHILELCQFAKYDWLAEANHGLRKDFEDKVLLFPRFDPVTIGLSIEQDKALNRTYDTLEDCVMEIESLKDELCLIEIRQTSTGRDQWNTPEVKTGVGKKDRLRKDRYSALLMANMAARQTRNARIQDSYEIYGGFAEVPASSKKSDVIFLGPNWYTEKMNGVY